MTKERYQVIPRTLCFVMNAGKILLIEYSEKKGAMRGFFNGVGGHVEYGEGIIENAEREIFEETGLRPVSTKMKGVFHAVNFFGKNCTVFVIQSEADTFDVVESDEGKLHWIDSDKFGSLNMFEDISLILEKINSLQENEVFTAKAQYDGGGKLLKFEFE